MRRLTFPALALPALTLSIALLLAACGASDPQATNAQDNALDALDAALVGNAAASEGDPALTAALHDQIMVDPALVQQANDDVVRPPSMPVTGAVPPDGIAIAAMKTIPLPTGLRSAPPPSADCPACVTARRALTLGALAQSQGGGTARCAQRLAYSTVWANRLPDALPLYPDARVAEAAGADGDGCALRVVSFVSAQPMQALLDFYYTRAAAAGFPAGHQANGGEHVLAGAKPGAGAYLVTLRPHRGGGTEVDLMVDAH
ncbi:MAG: hypothetical protein PGN23_11520 [Sphingomonas adhaesiva]|uniref:hypothetical protein n=1 Tax=Sphingomonas adhaesiva TaxID=28212 RepID=UPI002FFB9844